ncbi:MAG: Caspase domain [Planctomycetota bacterium]
MKFLFCGGAMLLALVAIGANIPTVEPLTKSAPTHNQGLFVGVTDFFDDSSISRLRCSVHDAIEMAWLFVVELKLIAPQNCVLLISGEPETDAELITKHYLELKSLGVRLGKATRANILAHATLMQFHQGTPASLVVCFLSSHGYHEQGIAWIMPCDAVNSRASETCVSAATLEMFMHTTKAGYQLLMVDACRRETGSTAGTAVQSSTSETARSSSLARLSSCSPGEVSYQSSSLGPDGHGVFTWNFLQGVRKAAQADEQGLVRLGAVMEHATRKATRWTQKECEETQHPATDASELLLSLPLCRRPLSEKAPKVTVSALKGARECSACCRWYDGSHPVDRKSIRPASQLAPCAVGTFAVVCTLKTPAHGPVRDTGRRAGAYRLAGRCFTGSQAGRYRASGRRFTGRQAGFCAVFRNNFNQLQGGK